MKIKELIQFLSQLDGELKVTIAAPHLSPYDEFNPVLCSRDPDISASWITITGWGSGQYVELVDDVNAMGDLIPYLLLTKEN